VAHSGLAEANPFARAGDVAFLHHRVEHDQQIEVEDAPIHKPHMDVLRMHFQNVLAGRISVAGRGHENDVGATGCSSFVAGPQRLADRTGEATLPATGHRSRAFQKDSAPISGLRRQETPPSHWLVPAAAAVFGNRKWTFRRTGTNRQRKAPYDRAQASRKRQEDLMLGMIGGGHRGRLILLVATAAWMLASGSAQAQIVGLNAGAPALGVPGAGAVGPVHIPLGTIELGTAGLSPLPGSTVPGLAPFGASANAIPALRTGLSPAPTSPAGSGITGIGGLGTTPNMQPGTLP
jgi:hypothetical protein